jgi:hypothetical protein
MKYKCDWPGCTAKSETRFSYDANDEPIDATCWTSYGNYTDSPVPGLPKDGWLCPIHALELDALENGRPPTGAKN